MTRRRSFGYLFIPELSTGVMERPVLERPPMIDMPPLNVIKCQCAESCPSSGPCDNEATGDDLLCDECRKAIEQINLFREGVFSAMFISVEETLSHCHECDPEFNRDGDDGAPSD
jgi:hypothetical protein